MREREWERERAREQASERDSEREREQAPGFWEESTERPRPSILFHLRSVGVIVVVTFL